MWASVPLVPVELLGLDAEVHHLVPIDHGHSLGRAALTAMFAVLLGLPPPTVDDLLKWPTIRMLNNPQRPIRGIPNGQEVSEEPVAGEAQHIAGEVLVFGGGVSGAESQIRGGDGHRHGGLT